MKIGVQNTTACLRNFEHGGQSVTLFGTSLVIFGGPDVKRELLNDLHILDLETVAWDEMYDPSDEELGNCFTFHSAKTFPKYWHIDNLICLNGFLFYFIYLFIVCCRCLQCF